MIPPDDAAFRIGDWRVEPALDEISQGGETVKLEPRSMRVLVCLAEHPGEVVSVELLLNTVWKDVVVTQDSVYQAIAGLRRALRDDPKEPGFIANVPRRGYRLIAPVGPPDKEAPTHAPPRHESSAHVNATAPEMPAPTYTQLAPALFPADGGSPTKRILSWGVGTLIALALVAMLIGPRLWRQPNSTTKPPAASIAVLPFLDLSEHHDQGYFSDGLAEELIDMLAQVDELRVPSHTSSFSFAGTTNDIEVIARRLRVTHVLEGSVRRMNDRIRVTAQLIRADDGYHLWSNTYDRDLNDIFEVQDEIAASVVSALKLRLVPNQHVVNAHRTENVQAYMLYLAGRQNYYMGPDFQRAIGAFREATVLDPRYAAAYAGLAEAMGYSSDAAQDSGPVLEQALQAANKAIELGPDLAEGYAARGLLRTVWLWDWTGARADIEKALALDPGSAPGHRRRGMLLAQTGLLAEGIAELRTACELDPVVEGTWGYLGFFLTAEGQYAASREAFMAGMRLEHGNLVEDHYYRGVNELMDHRVEAAREQFVQSLKPALRDAGIALVEHSIGHAEQSEAALDALIREHTADEPYTIATVYAWRGDDDKAFQWLERAYARRHTYLSRVKVDPLLKRLHGDPRFGALLRKMGLQG